MGTKRIDVAALVRHLDPDRLSGKRVEYVFGGGKAVKKRQKVKPGHTYPWVLS